MVHTVSCFSMVVDTDIQRVTRALMGASTTTSQGGKCRATLDIGFVLDSSGSLRRDYHKEKKFVNLLAEQLGVGTGGTRAGVVTYSYFVDHRYG